MASNLLLAPEIKQTYDMALLQRFRTQTIFNKYGVQKSIPARGGVNISFRRMESIRPVATASSILGMASLSQAAAWPPDAVYTSATGAVLTEGTFYAPTAIASWYEVTATVRQYGQAAYISDLDIHQALDPQISEYNANMREAMAELLDLVTRDELLTTGNVQYANSRTSASAVISGDYLTLTELRKASRTMKRVNAEPLEDGNYVVLGHPDTTYDLQGDSNITNVWVQGGGLGREADYWAPTPKKLPLGFNYYESTICPISRASGYGDVYNTFVLGKGAYVTVKLSDMPAEIIYHAPGTSGVADPLNQVATIGWKANFAAKIVNSDNMVLIKHQTSAFTGTRAGA